MAKYTVNQICYFSAAHVLRDYSRGCEKLHGHNYKVIIRVEANELNNLGMVIDYYEIEEISYRYIKKLDHQYINNVPPFDKINPTAENVADWLFDNISKEVNNERIKLVSITIWETDNNFVTCEK